MLGVFEQTSAGYMWSAEFEWAREDREGWLRTLSVVRQQVGYYVGSSAGALPVGLPANSSMNITPLCTISAQLFAEHQVTAGSHPS